MLPEVSGTRSVSVKLQPDIFAWISLGIFAYAGQLMTRSRQGPQTPARSSLPWGRWCWCRGACVNNYGKSTLRHHLATH